MDGMETGREYSVVVKKTCHGMSHEWLQIFT